jgi:hypothetical protein
LWVAAESAATHIFPKISVVVYDNYEEHEMAVKLVVLYPPLFLMSIAFAAALVAVEE